MGSMTTTTTTVPPQWTIGDRLAKARKTAGIGSSEMGERLGVTRTTIGNWESGRHMPSLLVLRAWAEETGVPLWWLNDDRPDAGDIAREPSHPTGRTAHTCPGQTALPIAA